MPAHRKPLSVLKLNGSTQTNPGRFAARSEPVACPGGIGEPPVALSKARKNIWAELVAQLPEGHLQSADRMLLEIVTHLVARLRNRKILVTKSEQALLVQCLSKLGLTPVDRSKVNIQPRKEEDPHDPWAEFTV